jgi:hypothetical protein
VFGSRGDPDVARAVYRDAAGGKGEAHREAGERGAAFVIAEELAAHEVGEVEVV